MGAMNVGLLTDSLSGLARREVFAEAARLGITTVELAAGNWSSSPHMKIDELVASEAAREELLGELGEFGLELEALNASGNQLHPTLGAEHDRVVRQTIRLAGQLGIRTLVMMSGLPAARGDSFPAWITTVWPPENLELLDYQWTEVAIPYWSELVRFANDHGVTRIAVEMHANQLVYSPPGLVRLREAVGETVGVNVDPSHLFWMGADPLEAIDLLGPAIHHVHAKDTRIEQRVSVRSRLETTPNDLVGDRAWNYVAVGTGHDVDYWAEFARRLGAVGYTGALSIENEDYSLAALESVAIAARTLHSALASVGD
nr:sugar phosphate isomerase/epimerase [Propionicimonas sp.]